MREWRAQRPGRCRRLRRRRTSKTYRGAGAGQEGRRDPAAAAQRRGGLAPDRDHDDQRDRPSGGHRRGAPAELRSTSRPCNWPSTTPSWRSPARTSRTRLRRRTAGAGASQPARSPRPPTTCCKAIFPESAHALRGAVRQLTSPRYRPATPRPRRGHRRARSPRRSLALRADDGRWTPVDLRAGHPAGRIPRPPPGRSRPIRSSARSPSSSDDQFRADGPPPLSSISYAEDFNEVKEMGGTSARSARRRRPTTRGSTPSRRRTLAAQLPDLRGRQPAHRRNARLSRCSRRRRPTGQRLLRIQVPLLLLAAAERDSARRHGRQRRNRGRDLGAGRADAKPSRVPVGACLRQRAAPRRRSKRSTDEEDHLQLHQHGHQHARRSTSRPTRWSRTIQDRSHPWRHALPDGDGARRRARYEGRPSGSRSTTSRRWTDHRPARLSLTLRERFPTDLRAAVSRLRATRAQQCGARPVPPLATLLGHLQEYEVAPHEFEIEVAETRHTLAITSRAAKVGKWITKHGVRRFVADDTDVSRGTARRPRRAARPRPAKRRDALSDVVIVIVPPR